MGGEFHLWSMASMEAEGQEPLRDSIYPSVLFCFAFLFSGPSPFLKFPEIHNFDCAEILTRFFFVYKLPCTQSRALTDVRGGHKTPGCTCGLWQALVGCGLRGPPFVLIPPPKNHKYSKIILQKKLSRLDFTWCGYSAIQKTCNKQELTLGTRSIG